LTIALDDDGGEPKKHDADDDFGVDLTSSTKF
jgi:hypothetical protein